MVLVIDAISNLLNCSPSKLRDHLIHPENRIQVLKEFMSRKVCTIHGKGNIFLFGGITRKDANRIHAYGRLRRAYNVNVVQHFFSKHRIRLRYPFLHCVIERFPWAQDSFYPIEVLDFVEDTEQEEAIEQIKRGNPPS